MQKNLTTGNAFKNVIYFSLPFFLSYFLQTLYGLADLFIIGVYDDTASISAVSIGGQVMHMLTVTIVGLAMGTTVTIGKAVGAKDQATVQKVIGNTATVFLAGSVVLTFVLILFASPIARIMSTPTEALDGTISYLTVCFIGIPFITAYNVISAVLRGYGDSKSPMYFIAVACVCNIGLDYLFIGAMDMGPVGAALGTTLSQTVSVVIALVAMIKSKNGIRVTKSDFKPHGATLKSIFKVGVPVAVQDGCIQISFLVITVFANRRGLTDSTAVGIVEKIIGVLFLVPSSMLSAVSAIGSQSFGANDPKRAKQTMFYAMGICVTLGTIIAITVQFAAPYLIRLFDDTPEVVRSGEQYLKSYSLDCIIAGVHFCFSGYFCAMEKSILSFTHNLISAAVRIPLSYYASQAFTDTLFPMGLASPIGSAASAIICVAIFCVLNARAKKKISE